MTTISAKTILRSRNASQPDKVLSTLLLRYPRFIHAELMTHRVFSRNSASSRAIPVKKLIQDVIDNPAIPLHWGKNQPGMQAREECDNPVIISKPMAILLGGEADMGWWEDSLSNAEAWLEARDKAVEVAKAFANAGYHKQIVNRLLEPFAHITVLVSATEWDNFLELRDHEDAEPHIQMLAREIRKCLEREDDIQTLQPGEWHLPFVQGTDEWSEFTRIELNYGKIVGIYETQIDNLRKISAACCASTSYKTVDGFDMTLERAQAIFDKLVTSKPIHASPAEHVAQADQWTCFGDNDCIWNHSEQHRNFVGFRQYRAMIENGNDAG